MERNFEKNIPHRETEPTTIEIKNITGFSGIQLHDLGQQTVKNIIAEIKNGKSTESSIRSTHNLDDNLPLEKALSRKAQEVIELYQTQIEEKTTKFSEQTAACIDMAHEKGYIQEMPHFSIIITHPFFFEGLSHIKPHPVTDEYNLDRDAVFMNINRPNKLLAHEIGHALSINKDNHRDGFLLIKKRPKRGKTMLEGNHWFNEGITVIWEEMSTCDDSDIPSRHEEGNLYHWYRETTKLILEKVGVTEDDALAAYFGDKPKRDQIQSAIRKQFNCSIDELQCLIYKIDTNWAQRVINGEPIEITIKKTTPPSIIEQLEKLSTIFPNVKIITKE